MMGNTIDTGYCLKCKMNGPMKQAAYLEMRNGKWALFGNCHVCGMTMYKLGVEEPYDHHEAIRVLGEDYFY